MSKRWDAAAYADMQTAHAKVANDLQEVSLKMHDEYAKDGPFSESRLGDYTAMCMRHAHLSREERAKKADLDAMALIEPSAAKRSAKSLIARWAARGADGLEEWERRDYLRADQADLGRISLTLEPEMTSTKSDDSTGQNLVDKETAAVIVDRLKAYGSVARVSNRIVTEKGGDLVFPQLDDTANYAEIRGQGVASSAQDFASFGSVTFKAYPFESKRIAITLEMIEDAVVDLEAYVNLQSLRRQGRGANRVFTNGDGSEKPFGVVTVAKAGITAAATAAITADEVLSLPYEVDRAYRLGGEEGEAGFMADTSPMIGYMLSDPCEKALRTMKDSDGRPLWVPSLTPGAAGLSAGLPAFINQYRYEVNADMDALATGKTPMVFGNFSFYATRMVNSVKMFRFFDSGTSNAVLIESVVRRDGRAVGAIVGTTCEAIAKLTLA